jgi:hypothetical protein
MLCFFIVLIFSAFLSFFDQFSFLYIGLFVIYYKTILTIFIEMKAVLRERVEKLGTSKGQLWHLLNKSMNYQIILWLEYIGIIICIDKEIFIKSGILFG